MPCTGWQLVNWATFETPTASCSNNFLFSGDFLTQIFFHWNLSELMCFVVKNIYTAVLFLSRRENDFEKKSYF